MKEQYLPWYLIRKLNVSPCSPFGITSNYDRLGDVDILVSKFGKVIHKVKVSKHVYRTCCKEWESIYQEILFIATFYDGSGL